MFNKMGYVHVIICNLPNFKQLIDIKFRNETVSFFIENPWNNTHL